VEIPDGGLAPGEVLDGRYRIVRELGSGAMGLVFVAEHLALGSQVAVKVLRPEYTSDAQLVARFEQEARAASAIGHPSIVHVFDLGRTPAGARYMVMELLEGRSLATVLEKDGRLTVARALEVTGQILDGLMEAHRNGIVHRDLKPENLFVVEKPGQPSAVKILDFGISKVLAGVRFAPSGERGTTVGTVMGTPAYMSPEQARGEVQLLDARTDLYAAGVVLYELLAGVPPFEGDNPYAVVAAVLEGKHTALRKARPDVPAAVAAVVERAMARDAKDRFADAAAMREAIRQAAGTSPSPPAPESAIGWSMPSEISLVAIEEVAAPGEPAPPPKPEPETPAQPEPAPPAVTPPPQLDSALFAPPPDAVAALPLAERPRTLPPRPVVHERAASPLAAPSRSSMRGLVTLIALLLAVMVVYKIMGPTGRQNLARSIGTALGWVE
jgi:serine/threonine-protein kinase